MFRWREFCISYNIDFVERGRNVARDRINIACPMCEAAGRPDPSEHLGLDLNSTRWACFRDPTHRGKDPVRLIKALLRCSHQEALSIIGDMPTQAGFESLKEMLEHISEPAALPKLEPTKWPAEFRRIKPTGLGRRYWKYIRSRGYPEADIARIAKQYHLRYASSGNFAWRLILPLYLEGSLVGWTGRKIVDDGEDSPRYLTYPPGDSLIKQTVFNAPALEAGGEVLALVEGPLDALKVDAYGEQRVRAVALMGVTATPSQVVQIIKGAEQRFERVVIVLDRAGTQTATSVLRAALSLIRPSVHRWRSRFDYAEDPGDIRPGHVMKFFGC